MKLSPYPTELAKLHCQRLIEHLDKTQNLTDNPELKNSNSFFATAPLFKPYKGHMFGILVCRPTRKTDLPLSQLDEDGCIVLKAFSGQYFGTWIVPGYVPPCFNVNDWNNEILYSDAKIKEATGTVQKKLSNELLNRIYNLYHFHCIDGSKKSFTDFYSLMPPIKSSTILPPTGTGDCCAPKLLNYAFAHGLRPISLAEFYYGAPNRSNTRHHLHYYPPCTIKCSHVLPEMLGIEIIYYDESIIIVNKPADMLSVPGRTIEKKDCVVSRIRKLFPDCIPQPSVHRLDMETSGLLVLAFTKEAHKNLSIQFQERQTQKKYEALIEGSLFNSKGKAAINSVQNCKTSKKKEPLTGHIELAFRLDPDNRPYQVYDPEKGKLGITNWKRIGEETLGPKLVTRIEFTPKTGRTHQLRLHSAHKEGLGCSIIGDTLYGKRDSNENRMMLHAKYLSFYHPDTGNLMEFESTPPF